MPWNKHRFIALVLLAFISACASIETDSSTRISPNTSDAPRATPTATHAPLTKAAMASCPVSLPNVIETPHPHFVSTTNRYQNAGATIFTVLWPEGRVIFEPGGPGFVLPDGSLSMKWGWFRTIPGKVLISGRRLDAPAPTMPLIMLRGVPDGYGSTGFHAGALIFPTEGCWEVTATVAGDSLTLVTLVIKVGDLPIPTERPPDLYIRIEISRLGLYPIPRSCRITPVSGRQQRRGFPAWWWLGDALDAGSDIGILFEGVNEIHWQYHYEGDLFVTAEPLDEESEPFELISARPYELREWEGYFADTVALFPSAGCWKVRAQVGDQSLDAIVYVYPATCRAPESGNAVEGLSAPELCKLQDS